MDFLDVLISLMLKWNICFSQKRTIGLAIRQSLSCLCLAGRSTITQGITFAGRDHLDWSSDYKLFSRSCWSIKNLFQPIVEETTKYFENNYIVIAYDETKLKKTGKKIPGTQYHRDPLSPAFHTNMIYGLRVLQGSALLPLYNSKQAKNEDQISVQARGIPVCFKNIPVVKKPGRKATEEDLIEYNEAKKQCNLSHYFLETVKETRKAYDAAGVFHKTIIAVTDGGFCNKTVFGAELDRTNILTRCRRDAVLCYKAQEGSRLFYDKNKFTPEEVKNNPDIPWKEAEVFISGQRRQIRYKDIDNVLWQGGAKRKTLRLIVIAPTPYKISKNGKTYYRNPAFLLTDNFDASTIQLIQMYVDRWEIEVNHRDEKTILGVGQAQVWNENSVTKQPAFVVAAYSMLILASILCYGSTRTKEYNELPKWRNMSKRPSCNDLKNILTKYIIKNPNRLVKYGMYIEKDKIMTKLTA